MGYISNITRKIVFWNYPRTSWQWDVLCVLILVFIFLTPKSWFATPRRATTMVISADVVGPQPDKADLEKRLKAVSGRDGTVVGIRERKDDSGRLIAYEVDIR